MICRVATSRTNKRLIRPFDFRQVLQAVLVAFESVIELNGIHTFEYFSLYHATKVAINIGLGALSAYTYFYNFYNKAAYTIYQIKSAPAWNIVSAGALFEALGGGFRAALGGLEVVAQGEGEYVAADVAAKSQCVVGDDG